MLRSSQVLGRLGRSTQPLNGSSRCWQAVREHTAPSTDEASVSSLETPIFAACVLQRLPIVRPPVPPHHAQHLIWARQRGLETGELKDYPEGGTKGRGDVGSKQEKQDLRTFKPVPTITSADNSGEVRSMRRRLSEGLYLVVRSRGGGGQQEGQQQQEQQGQTQGKGNGNGGESLASPLPSSPPSASDRDGGRRSGGGDGGSSSTWGFPLAVNRGQESISDTAQRALHSVIGRSHPVFFVGKAPMAHLMTPAKGNTFFMLAQTVDEPWDIRLVEGGPAQDYAWVTKQELLSSYAPDARLRELVSKML